MTAQTMLEWYYACTNYAGKYGVSVLLLPSSVLILLTCLHFRPVGNRWYALDSPDRRTNAGTYRSATPGQVVRTLGVRSIDSPTKLLGTQKNKRVTPQQTLLIDNYGKTPSSLASYAICTGVPHFPLSFIAAFFLLQVFNRSLIRTLSGSPPRWITVFDIAFNVDTASSSVSTARNASSFLTKSCLYARCAEANSLCLASIALNSAVGSFRYSFCENTRDAQGGKSKHTKTVTVATKSLQFKNQNVYNFTLTAVAA